MLYEPLIEETIGEYVEVEVKEIDDEEFRKLQQIESKEEQREGARVEKEEVKTERKNTINGNLGNKNYYTTKGSKKIMKLLDTPGLA